MTEEQPPPQAAALDFEEGEGASLESVLSGGFHLVKDCVRYLQENAWYIVILLAVGYLINMYVLDPWRQQQSSRPDPRRSARFESDMQRVRLQQQEEAQERARLAQKLQQEKKRADALKKNESVQLKKNTSGRKLGTGSDDDGGGGYNPMQPWSSSSGSGGYRPQRRNVRRG